MESNSLRSSPPAPEDHLGVVNRTIHGEANKVAQEVKPPPKASCKHNNTTGEEEEEDEDGGFSWPPPRSYTCGFCKRKFRSAQALGGHMNVHRRDRAKLRRSPPLDHHHSYQRNTKLIIPSPCSSASTDQMKKWDPTTLHGPSSAEPIKFLKLSTFSGFNGESSDGGCKIWKKVKNLVRMEKEINLLSGSNDVDLELRLGF